MKFALAGNPNSGKTTLFNALTGSTAHVGNWPGVTVEKKTGTYKKLSEKVDIVDLPGIYSLSPYTPEEVISRNFVLNEDPDCVINIIDASNLERNLYLTTQLCELDKPIVIALNMMDMVKKAGDKIDTERLSTALGVPVVEIVALRGKGIKQLMQTAYKEAQKPRRGKIADFGKYSAVIEQYASLYDEHKVKNPLFHAVKLFEKDSYELDSYPEVVEAAKGIEVKFDETLDPEAFVADCRYKYLSAESVHFLERNQKPLISRSDKADKILTHRIWGIPIFLLIMLVVFHLTFSENLFLLGFFIPEGSFDIPIIGTDAINSPGVMLQACVEWLTGTIGDAVSGAMPEGTWYTSLVCDGLLEGLFSVLSFIPQILCLFFFLSILEDSGYMARVAFIMDRAFRKLGLSGKAFMPLIMCFGCAVPGIMATRTLENDAERRRAIMLTPFFSCGAKLPIWAAFAGVFAHVYSGMNAEVVVYGMYILGIAVAVLAAFILNKSVLKGETPPFIMELPAYHAPRPANLVAYLWNKLKHYIFRAATIIAGAIVVIWFLSTFNFSFAMVEDSGDSIIGQIAKWFTWLFVPLGFGMGANGWKFVVAAITGLIAKEMVVATMGTFAGIDGDSALEMDGSEMAETPLGAMMLGIGGALGGVNIAVPAMLSFMAFNLLSVPCMAAVAAARGELKSAKKLWGAIAFWLITAYSVSLAVFWFGVLFAYKWWLGLIVCLAIAAAIATLVTLKILRTKKGTPTFVKNKGKKI